MKSLFIVLTLCFPQFSIAQEKKQNANPDISLNGLLLYQNSSRGNNSSSDPKNGFSLDEAELIFSSDVDVYFKFFSALALHKETQWKLEPEEVYVESLNLPSVILKAGKMYGAMGKYNSYHKHALPFIDANLINKQILGDEGLNEVGISAAYLLPLSWFSEITLQALNPASTPFSATQANSSVFIGKYKNLFDVNDSLTTELGLSAASGANELDKKTTLYGADLTFKWRPVKGGKYNAFVWSTEYLSSAKEDDSGGTKAQGFTTFVQWQFTQRWWAQLRNEHMFQKVGTQDSDPKRKSSALIAFVPTEFTAVRLQYDRYESTSFDTAENKVMLQLSTTIGTHPAHSY